MILKRLGMSQNQSSKSVLTVKELGSNILTKNISKVLILRNATAAKASAKSNKRTKDFLLNADEYIRGKQ